MFASSTRVDETVHAWLAAYDTPDACVAELLCDRHDPASIAFSFVEPDMSSFDMTYADLAERSKRLATVLAARGVGAEQRVAVLIGKRAELVITLVALWRLGAVHVPLFTAFATGAIEMRVVDAGVRLVVTEPAQRPKIEPIDGIEIIETGPELDGLIDAAEPHAEPVAVGGAGALTQLYTSGTTGTPKGVVVPVRAVASFHSYLNYGLDVRPDDVYWNAADPGWAYGLYYGIIAPLLCGRRNLLLNSGFTPESTVNVIESFGVTNFAGAPTIYRALARSGVAENLRLRRASSAGEPLTPDVVDWSVQALGTEVRDHYGQTEVGMVIGNGWHPDVFQPLEPGSMGRPLPGFAANVVDGQIALDVKNSPLLWFNGYYGAPDATSARFTDSGEWYLTADAGRVNDEGCFFFSARDDDVILAAGYRIGPFDVESVLITHPLVADVAVVGRPDPDGIRGEVVEAFVVLNAGAQASDSLARQLQALVRDQYSKHAYPRYVNFVDNLPRTPSGKVQRYLLRRR